MGIGVTFKEKVREGPFLYNSAGQGRLMRRIHTLTGLLFLASITGYLSRGSLCYTDHCVHLQGTGGIQISRCHTGHSHNPESSRESSSSPSGDGVMICCAIPSEAATGSYHHPVQVALIVAILESPFPAPETPSTLPDLDRIRPHPPDGRQILLKKHTLII